MDNRVKSYDPQKFLHHSPLVEKNTTPAIYYPQTIATQLDQGLSISHLQSMHFLLVLSLSSVQDIYGILLIEYEWSSYLKYVQSFPFSCLELIVSNPPPLHSHHLTFIPNDVANYVKLNHNIKSKCMQHENGQ